MAHVQPTEVQFTQEVRFGIVMYGPSTVGTPMIPRNLVRSFKALLQRAELPDIRFHDLRHSCASLLAAQGVPARVAMDVLGHASIQTTQNIYTHVFDDARRQAAAVMDSLFGATNEGATSEM